VNGKISTIKGNAGEKADIQPLLISTHRLGRKSFANTSGRSMFPRGYVQKEGGVSFTSHTENREGTESGRGVGDDGKVLKKGLMKRERGGGAVEKNIKGCDLLTARKEEERGCKPPRLVEKERHGIPPRGR